MRGTIGVRLQNSTISNATRQTLVPFSTSSGFGGGGGGRGGGRGRGGSGQVTFNFGEKAAPGNPNPNPSPNVNESKPDATDSLIPPGAGRGHGRGGTVPPSTDFPSFSFSSFMSSIHQPGTGRGRGRGRGFDPLPPQFENDSGPKKPVFIKREDNVSQTSANDSLPPKKPVFTISEDVRPVEPIDLSGDNESDNRFVMTVPKVLPGGGRGRGKPLEEAAQEAPQALVVNRHIRVRQTPADAESDNAPRRQPMNRFARDDGDGSGRGRGRGRDVYARGRGSRGRGGRGGRGDGRGGFKRYGDDRTSHQDIARSNADGLYVGDNADGEKLAKKLGPEIMDQITEAYEEIIERVLPSPLQDEYVEAMDINCAIEFEPEYAVEFDNPDIDEKEPIALRDALEKMKPFLMTYEGIRSQEEWEEVIEELMQRVPLLKKIVDHYSGPDRVTAKKQQEELERVAKTLPTSAPSSVKEFTNRAVISLQSNPGWGFDKKCQFMDKLVFEVSQHHK